MEERDKILKQEVISKRKIALELAREDAVHNLEIRMIQNKKKMMKHKEEELKKI